MSPRFFKARKATPRSRTWTRPEFAPQTGEESAARLWWIHMVARKTF